MGSTSDPHSQHCNAVLLCALECASAIVGSCFCSCCQRSPPVSSVTLQGHDSHASATDQLNARRYSSNREHQKQCRPERPSQWLDQDNAQAEALLLHQSDRWKQPPRRPGRPASEFGRRSVLGRPHDRSERQSRRAAGSEAGWHEGTWSGARVARRELEAARRVRWPIRYKRRITACPSSDAMPISADGPQPSPPCSASVTRCTKLATPTSPAKVTAT